MSSDLFDAQWHVDAIADTGVGYDVPTRCRSRSVQRGRLMAVIGSITLTKSLDDEGRVMIDVEYDGITVYEAIGLLTVELDTQRGDLQEVRRGR